MIHHWRIVWGGFREVYGPALVGGIFLCIADLMQSDRQGQIFKVGGMVKRNFLNGFGLEEGSAGVLLILLLGVLLCWVWRPKTPSDSFAKGASVFAVLAALVPANKLPGTPVSSYTLPDERSAAVARSGSGTSAWEMLASIAGAIPSARAETVIPLRPIAKAKITLSPAANVPGEEFARQIQESGVNVWLTDADGNPVAYQRITQPQFTVTKPAGKYLMEVEMDGYQRLRVPITLENEPRAYDLRVGEKTRVPIGIQRLYGPDLKAPVPNEKETFKFSGAELSRRGDYAGAVALYDKSLSAGPQDKETLNYRGYALYKMARFDDAARPLAAAVKIDPSYFVARLNAAKVACRRGQFAEARNAVLGAPALAAQALAVIAADGEFTGDCKALAADLKARLAKRAP